jgi:hypothetical protein
MDSFIIPTVSSLNVLISPPSTNLYYYRRGFHQAFCRALVVFYDFYGFMFEYYQIRGWRQEVSDMEVHEHVAKYYSLSQRWYIHKYDDGTYLSMLKCYLKLQKCFKLFESLETFIPTTDGNEAYNFFTYMHVISPLIQNTLNAVSDHENKSTMFPRFFDSGSSFTLNALGSYIEQIGITIPKLSFWTKIVSDDPSFKDYRL